MKIKCAVVEDDPKDLDSIKKVISQLSVETRYLFETNSYPSFDRKLLDMKYDLYILDIDLPGINGFEITTKIYEVNERAVIIFCSHHEGLVFDSFKLNPFYFVRKSFLEDDLSIALRKYIRVCSSFYSDYLIETPDRIFSVPYHEILYFEVSHNTMYIHTLSTEYSQRKTMKQLLEEIPQGQFIHVSQSYLVNAGHIEAIHDNKVCLRNGQQIDISRRMFRQVKEEYVLFLSRKDHV